MFGRNEKLKRLEAENKLSEALEELISLRKKNSELSQNLDKTTLEKYHLISDKQSLSETLEKLKKDYVVNEEAKAVVESLKIIKAVVFDKPKEKEGIPYDNFLQSLLAQQQASMQNINKHGLSNLSCLGSIFR
jgi:predicted nuclease with TOPRIM domain